MNNRPFAYLSRAILGLVLTGPAAAQVRVFPASEVFQYPVGAPKAAGFVGRVINTSRGETRFGAETEADLAVGGNLPLIALRGGERAPFIGLTVRVTARFSLDDPLSAMISHDWVAGFHLVSDHGPWRLVGEVIHESSHLGDEYAEKFKVRRLDWTREVGSLWIRRRFGSFSAHVVGSYNLIDALPVPRAALGVGLDYRGSLGPLLGGEVHPTIGVFADAPQYAGWKATTTGRAGLELERAGRLIGVSLVYANGLSTQRQFYARKSRYAGFELRFVW